MGQKPKKTGSGPLAEAMTGEGLSQEELTAQVQRVLGEKDWMQRSAAFNQLQEEWKAGLKCGRWEIADLASQPVAKLQASPTH